MKLLALLVSATTAFVAPLIAGAAPQDIVVSDGAVSVRVQTTGHVTFNLSSESIFDLHGDGTLGVTATDGNTTRTLFAQGSVVDVRVNGVAVPYDDAARAWLRDVLSALPPPPPPPPPPA